MTESVPEPRFNALTDPWLPLTQEDGTSIWASPVEVLCGEKDGEDLDYPRDDFRVYGRLLLSALVQALFPAKNKDELNLRLATPLSRKEVEARITPVLSDFDLFGPKPFLQITPPTNATPEGGAARFVFGDFDLYQPRVLVEAVCLPIALVTIFAEQTYAGGAGRGYVAGPGGQPGAFTLVDAGSIRKTMWANTLTVDTVKQKYTSDDADAWSNVKRTARPRAAIGIVGGLFFQPRSIWLSPAGQGVCSFTGVSTTLVRLSPFLPKSELTKKPSKGEDVWAHPCAPLAVNSQGIAAIRLNAERPAWTGLAQLLDPISKSKTKIAHPLEGPAPVLAQWKSLNQKLKVRLLVLDFDRDKANVRRRFFEAFPLTDDFFKTDTLEHLRLLVADTQDVEFALRKALTRAHDDRKQGGLALADAQASFWARSESPFLTWLDSVVRANQDTNAGWEQIQSARAAMMATLHRTAISIFDAHVELSEFDPRKQQRVAKARRGLGDALRPKRSAPPLTPKHTEVTP
jgi:CRISPR type I-E-associated protein CasA/Cse1